MLSERSMPFLRESVKAMPEQKYTWEPIGIRWGLVGDVHYNVSSRAAGPELSAYLTTKPPANEMNDIPPPAAVIPQVPSPESTVPPPLPTPAPKKRVRIR